MNLRKVFIGLELVERMNMRGVVGFIFVYRMFRFMDGFFMNVFLRFLYMKFIVVKIICGVIKYNEIKKFVELILL